MSPTTFSGLDAPGIADFLWNRFQLQTHGKELVPLVGQGTEGSSREALVVWVRQRIGFYRDLGIDRPLLHLESELARILRDSDLPGGELSESISWGLPDLPEPAPMGGFQLIRGSRRDRRHRERRPRLALVPSLTIDHKGE